jgi:hypothetical protein
LGLDFCRDSRHDPFWQLPLVLHVVDCIWLCVSCICLFWSARTACPVEAVCTKDMWAARARRRQCTFSQHHIAMQVASSQMHNLHCACSLCWGCTGRSACTIGMELRSDPFSMCKLPANSQGHSRQRHL